MTPAPITYREFLERLKIFEAAPPFIPKLGEGYLIYRWCDVGYFPKPSGPAYPFIHRPWDALVPVVEIEAALAHLEIPSHLFWDIQKH